MAAHEAANSISGYVDFAKWGMDGFTDSDEEDILCGCGKVSNNALQLSLMQLPTCCVLQWPERKASKLLLRP